MEQKNIQSKQSEPVSQQVHASDNSVPQLHSKCPICGKSSDFHYRPFCSKRCADLDLNRWLSGVYRIETDETPDTVIPDPSEE